MTLTVDGVDVSNVLIDSGAICNLMGQQTWNWLKTKGIQCEPRCSASVVSLWRYGASADPWNVLCDCCIA